MSDSKKYYYLKLKEDFFSSDSMIVLESMPDGYKYSNILLKLYLRSLKNEGKLMFNDRIPFNSQMLAQVTRHSVGDVEKAVKIFRELDLIEVLNNGAIYMADIQNFVGKSSSEADRKRAYRKRIDSEKQALIDEKDKCPDKSPPELEIELELEKEIDIEREEVRSPAEAEPSIPYKEIIDHLNKKADRNFKHGTESTKRFIRGRWDEGNDLEDFKQVIDNKVGDWLNDDKMNEYLRPKTLFNASNFEGYLNQKPTQQGGGSYGGLEF